MAQPSSSLISSPLSLYHCGSGVEVGGENNQDGNVRLCCECEMIGCEIGGIFLFDGWEMLVGTIYSDNY